MKHLLGERLQEKTPAAVSYTCSATQGEALVSPKSSEGSGAPLPRRVHTAQRPRSSPPAPACAPPPLPRPSAAAAPLVETSAPAPLDPSAPPPLEATRPRSAPPTRRSSRLAARAGAQGPAASGEVPALAHHGALAGRRGREIRCRPCRIRSSEEWIHAGEVPPCRSRSVSPAPPPPFHPRGEEKSGRQPPSRASLRRVRPAQGAALALPLRRRRDAILEKAAVRSRGQKRRRRRASLDAASSTASSTPRSTARSSLRPAQLSMDPNQPNDGSQGGFPGGNNPHYHQGWNPYMYGYQHPPSWPPQGYMPINPNASMMRPTPPVFDPAENTTAAMEKDDKDCEEIPASSVPKGKEKRTKVPRIKLSNFSPEEDKNLVMSWLEISNDPIKANAQRKEGYWLNILHRYNLRRGSYPERTIKSLQSRWDTTCGVLHNIYLNKQRIKFRETC